MMILVMYENGSTGMIPENELQSMIDAGSIMKFRRDGQWATLNQDMTRQTDTPDFTGSDRRASHTHH